MTVTLLCVGDLHLGRRPTRLPAELGLRPEDLGPEAAWRRAVDEALERRVDAVLLAGDVIERIEDRFRAFAALEDGVRRLSAAGVRVLAVAGNHDVEALPRLVQRSAGLELLGAGAERWQRVRIEGQGSRLDLWGWSFRQRLETLSPLASFPADRARDGQTPTLGLLHTELDEPGSRYAPVRREALAALGLDGWLLGHVHRPAELSSRAPIGYLGSLSPLDPGEPGQRGPWLVESPGRGPLRFTHLPLAPLRYEGLDLDVAALPEQGPGDLADTLALHLERELLPAFAARQRTALQQLRALALRIQLSGESAHGPFLRAAARNLTGQALRRPEELADCTVFVESFVDRTRPRLDLVALSRDNSYPGLLARRLLALEQGQEEGRRLLAAARDRWSRDAAEHAPWRELGAAAEPPAEGELRAALLDSGRRALVELLAQGAPAAGGGER
jgi:exonuclease SbcD